MAIPVNNPSKVTRRRAKSKKKQNNKNLGSAPSALSSALEDNTATRENSSLFRELMGPRKPTKVVNADTPVISKESNLGGYESVDPTGAPKQTLLQKQKRDADKIIAGGLALGKKRKDIGMMGESAGDTPKPLAPKPAPPRASPHPDIVTSKLPKPVTSKPVTPKMAPSKPPSKPPRPRPRLSPPAGAMEELGISPGGENQPKASKKAPKKDKTEGGDYKSYSKDNNNFMYMTQQGYDKQEIEDMGGEKFGGRPGRGKMKTQGMNKTAKRKAGFSGKGSGAALRGF